MIYALLFPCLSPTGLRAPTLPCGQLQNWRFGLARRMHCAAARASQMAGILGRSDREARLFLGRRPVCSLGATSPPKSLIWTMPRTRNCRPRGGGEHAEQTVCSSLSPGVRPSERTPWIPSTPAVPASMSTSRSFPPVVEAHDLLGPALQVCNDEADAGGTTRPRATLPWPAPGGHTPTTRPGSGSCSKGQKGVIPNCHSD
jgi:hypothetical protein